MPVDLVTVDRQDQCRSRWRRRPRRRRPRSKSRTPHAWKPPPLPQFAGCRARARTAAARRFKIKPERRRSRQRKPTGPDQEADSQDFAALLNKLTAPAKTPPNAKVGPRTVQGIGAANAMTADLADALQKPDLSMLESAGRRAQRQRSGGGFRSCRSIPTVPSRRPPQSAIALRLRGNPYTRAAAEAAERAIYQCAAL